jgi:glycosyltransferase involved in cell wall biosynthesis
MSDPLVSLVMPAWKPRPDWLRQAVGGALAQRGCRVELLVVDDGSPEPVAELLSAFDDPRLRTMRIDHAGATIATNAGMAAARGDFLRFIDADDVIDPDSTARLLDLTGGRDDVIAYGATMFCDEQLRPLWKMTSDVEGDGVRACLLGRFTARPHAFLFPRRVIEATGEWATDLAVSYDWDFILRALEHASVRSTDAVATYYRRHPSGATANSAEGERGARYVIDHYFQRHPDQRGTRLERQARGRMLAHIGRVYATHRRPGKAIAKLARAASLDPGAVWFEVSQGLPAAAAYGRRRLHMKPPRGMPERAPITGD